MKNIAGLFLLPIALTVILAAYILGQLKGFIEMKGGKTDAR